MRTTIFFLLVFVFSVIPVSASGVPCGEVVNGVHVYCNSENDYFFCSAPSAEWEWQRTERVASWGGADYTVVNFQCGQYYPPDVTTVYDFDIQLGIVTIEHGEAFDVWCPASAQMRNYSKSYENKIIPISRLDCMEK